MGGNGKARGPRCKPGDLARIKRAWNALLVGELVFVRSYLPGNMWLVSLLGEPALGVGADRKRLVITRTLIADDAALEPLDSWREINSLEAVTGSGEREARPDSEAYEASMRMSGPAHQICLP